MSNPTTPFSWQMPTATDLVTDLPADFEVFGQAVATSMGDLLGGTTGQVLSKTSATDMAFTWVDSDDTNAIQNAIVTAKGNLIGASASATPLVLAVGTNGQTLVADSAEATGLKWATPASGGGMTLLSTTTLTGADVRIQSISQAYVNLFILVVDATLSTNGIPRLYTQNNVINYYTEQAGLVNATAYNEQTAAGINLPNNVGTNTHDYAIQIFNYTSTTSKTFSVAGIAFDSGGPKKAINTQGGYHNGVAITEVDFGIDGATTYSSGTVYIYGVK